MNCYHDFGICIKLAVFVSNFDILYQTGRVFTSHAVANGALGYFASTGRKGLV